MRNFLKLDPVIYNAVGIGFREGNLEFCIRIEK